MATQQHNFDFDTTANSVRVTVEIQDTDGNVIDRLTKIQPTPIPANGDEGD